LVTACIVILVKTYRDRLEADRRLELQRSQAALQRARDQLEARVAERTAELERLNTSLQDRIVERAHADQALADERNLLRTLIDHIPEEIFAVDAEQRYMLNNMAHRYKLGIQSFEAMLGKTVYDFFPPDLAARIDADDRAVMQAGQPQFDREWQVDDASGRRQWFLQTKVPLRDAQGAVSGLVGIIRDITHLKQTEVSLQLTNTELEERVAQRTAELSALNARLLAEISERQLAEQQLQYQANLLQNVSDAIISTDAAFVIRSWNKAAERIYGWTETQALGKGMGEFLSIEYMGDEGNQVLQQFIDTGSWQGEVIQRRRDNAALNVFSSVSILKDPQGNPIGSLVVNRDITRRKQAEAAEREQRRLAEALRDTASVIGSTLDFDEVLDQILDQVTQVVPHDATSIMLIEDQVARVARHRGFSERGLTEYVTNLRLDLADLPALGQALAQKSMIVISDTSQSELWIDLPETHWIRSHIAVPIVVRDSVIGLLNVDGVTPNQFNHSHVERLAAFASQAAIAIENARLYEAASRHASEMEKRVIERTQELEEEQAQLRAILDSIGEGVIGQIFNDTTREYINPALCQMTGYSPDEWRIRLLKPAAMSQETFKEQLTAVYQTVMQQGVWQGEGRLARKDGSEFEASLISTRIDDKHGRPIGTVTIVRDVSQEKALQAQQARFVANASHELRTPLTNLHTRLYLLRKTPERLPEHLEILDSVANRMRRLVEDLLELSRFERGVIPLERRDTDLADLIREIVHIQQAEAAKKNIHLDCDLPATPLRAHVDPERITQVITNLVINAIHYTPDQGQVSVLAVLNDTTGQPTVSIHVQDSGMGIAPEHLPLLFQPFYRGVKSQGSGLGLSISKEIVEKHGGQISVESQVGLGSCFTVSLGLLPEV
jgi:PAS domain S-box-containing protein